MRQSLRNSGTAVHDDVYANLQVEASELLKQRDTALEADPRSVTYRQYVARMQAHIAALAVYLDIAQTTE